MKNNSPNNAFLRGAKATEIVLAIVRQSVAQRKAIALRSPRQQRHSRQPFRPQLQPQQNQRGQRQRHCQQQQHSNQFQSNQLMQATQVQSNQLMQATQVQRLRNHPQQRRPSMKLSLC